MTLLEDSPAFGDGGRRGGLPPVCILGVPIAALDFADAVAALRTAMRTPGRRVVFFANAHTLGWARRDAGYRDILNDAELVLGDGTGVRWAARLGGVRLPANLNGTDLVPALLQAAEGDGLRCYLLGASPETVARAAAAIGRRFPGWTIAGWHHGFLDAEATERVLAELAAATPDLLLVGMGNPVQEQWIAVNRERLSANLTMGVGALFAYLSGDYRRAPRALCRLGLEWLGVLLTQRHKWPRYLIGAPSFLFHVALERLSWRRR